MRRINDSMLLGYEHPHKWELEEQISLPLHTNKNLYACKCGLKKITYSNPVEELEEKIFFKKYGHSKTD